MSEIVADPPAPSCFSTAESGNLNHLVLISSGLAPEARGSCAKASFGNRRARRLARPDRQYRHDLNLDNLLRLTAALPGFAERGTRAAKDINFNNNSRA
jgi:hypothetical protein